MDKQEMTELDNTVLEASVENKDVMQEATVSVAALIEDLEKTGVKPETLLGISVNMMAQAYCKYFNNRVPVDGSDFRVGEFVVSIYPALSVDAKKKIQSNKRLIKKKEKQAK